jgi:hypothetical protein
MKSPTTRLPILSAADLDEVCGGFVPHVGAVPLGLGYVAAAKAALKGKVKSTKK